MFFLFYPEKRGTRDVHTPGKRDNRAGIGGEESFGQLVVLGFDVAVFTPAPYRRPRLGRPS